jgi:hypothetical protein
MEPIELKAAYCRRVRVFEWEGHTFAQLKEIRMTSAAQTIPVVDLDGLDFYCRSAAEGPVAFIGMDDNESHAQVLTRDGRLVSRRIREIALRIDLGPTRISNYAYLKRNGSKRG